MSPNFGSTTAIDAGIPSYIFAEKLVRIDSALWRLAIEASNRVLVDYVTKLTKGGPQSGITKPVRTRIWKEITDVYEIFLVGYCGRDLSSNSLSTVALEADESLEMTILETLGDIVLKLPIDTPVDVVQRLVSTLDRCASRTCSLPVETLEMMPPHYSRFSLTCLQKLFSLSSYFNEINWNMTRFEVNKISIMVLMTRCEYILSWFLTDEKGLALVLRFKHNPVCYFLMNQLVDLIVPQLSMSFKH
ncbi:unnamed protein product [Vicia faba]|uniref:Uncharacterized protein n=1 Tax=Vicia faba TaxID=3906 RepID=A0AAV1AVM8_VICFA|nr:unnamed protein product [Vicia faba]